MENHTNPTQGRRPIITINKSTLPERAEYHPYPNFDETKSDVMPYLEIMTLFYEAVKEKSAMKMCDALLEFWTYSRAVKEYIMSNGEYLECKGLLFFSLLSSEIGRGIYAHTDLLYNRKLNMAVIAAPIFDKTLSQPSQWENLSPIASQIRNILAPVSVLRPEQYNSLFDSYADDLIDTALSQLRDTLAENENGKKRYYLLVSNEETRTAIVNFILDNEYVIHSSEKELRQVFRISGEESVADATEIYVADGKLTVFAAFVQQLNSLKQLKPSSQDHTYISIICHCVRGYESNAQFTSNASNILKNGETQFESICAFVRSLPKPSFPRPKKQMEIIRTQLTTRVRGN